ncbi:polyprenyl synthetase family protein [Tissierella creatinini]|nr:polyprenyl synthetase family protein [Tissierella creatinini]TJX69098.1 polyprenyl synthetase family protein [Soehngenia saccharolytica]
MDIVNEIEKQSKVIDFYLMEIMKKRDDFNKIIFDAMEYSLFTGGKRLRPIMTLKTYSMFDDDLLKVMPFAIAIEMIHTYSLIHDDLPCMDNDDFRRGKPTNHKVYGEAMAVLAGDGLLNLAFETMSEHIYKNSKTELYFRRNIRAMKEISTYSGTSGMIGGQIMDLMSSFNNMDEEKLFYMYRSKTAALIQASIVSGAIIGGADSEDIRALRDFGLYLGLAYQIQDDLLDESQDEYINKFTYLRFHSIEEAEEKVADLSQDAINSLRSLKNRDIGFLKELTGYLIKRDV